MKRLLTQRQTQPILYESTIGGASGGERIRTTAKKVARGEDGKVLILALVLLVVGAFILAPLLGLMSTGLVAGQIYEKKTAELYSADAGVEDALWKIRAGDIPPEPYFLVVNGKDVLVKIESTDAIAFLTQLLGIQPKNSPHSDWITVYRSPEPGVFEIELTYVGSATTKRIEHVGAWLVGEHSYLQEQTPSSSDIRSQYPDHTFQESTYMGGTVFIWEWPSNPSRPTFTRNETKTLTFGFTPSDSPSLSIGWSLAGSADIYLSYDENFNAHLITATAFTDAANGVADAGSQTTVVARATVSGCGGRELSVLSWNMAPDWDG